MGNDNEVWEQYYYKEDSEGKKIIDYVEIYKTVLKHITITGQANRNKR
jgi:hypothetical protein